MKRVGDAARALLPASLGRVLRLVGVPLRVSPGLALLGVLLVLCGQLALLAAVMLPWKVVVVLAAPSAVAAWGLFAVGGDAAAWPWAAGAVAALLVHFACRWLHAGVCTRGAAAMVARHDKILLFPNQQVLAARAYHRLAACLAGGVFWLAAGAFLLWVYPRLGLRLLAICVVLAGVLAAALHRNAARAPGVARKWVAAGAEPLVHGGFFAAVGWVMWDATHGRLPGLMWVLWSVLIWRQALVQAAVVARNAVALHQSLPQLEALFLPDAPAPAALPDMRRPFSRLYAAATEAEGPAAPWLATVLAQAAGVQGGVVCVRWHTLRGGGTVAYIGVEVLDGPAVPDATAGLPPAPRAFAIKLFDTSRETRARHEARFLLAAPAAAPVPHFYGACEVEGLACHVLDWHPGWEVVPAAGVEAARLRVCADLLAVPPPEALGCAYFRANLAAADRVDAALLAALGAAAQPAEQADVAALAAAAPALAGQLRALPVRFVLPMLDTNLLWTLPDGRVLAGDWTRWALAPAGAGWPVGPRSAVRLAAALAACAPALRTADGGQVVQAPQVQLAAQADLLLRRAAAGNYPKCMPLIPRLLATLADCPPAALPMCSPATPPELAQMA